VGENGLTLSWVGTDAVHRLNLISAPDGSNFANKTTFEETSPSGLALATVVGPTEALLFLAWTGSDRRLNIMSFPPGSAAKVTLNEISNFAPALAFSPAGSVNTFILAWTGTDGRINMMRSADGSNFGDKVTLDDTSAFGPALVHAPGAPFLIAWTGTDQHRSLNAAVFG
jgi:hypothetical protein